MEQQINPKTGMSTKKKVVMGVASVFALTLLAASGTLVYAQSAQSSKNNLMDRVAQIVDVDSAKLKDGFKQATKEKIDQDVKDGNLTQEEANKIKEKIDNGEMPFGAGGGPRKMMHIGGANPEELASFLGLTKEELRTQMESDKTLLEIAKSKGKSEADLKNFLSQKFDERLKEAVSNGKLTQDEANKIAENKDEMIEDFMNGKRPERGIRRIIKE